jgi:Cu(I)/Ag(I) efflux system membrane fusion protein
MVVVMGSCGKNAKEAVQEADTLTQADAQHPKEEQDVTRDESGGKPQFTVDQIFQEQLSGLFSAYINLKDAFVASDLEKAKKEAKQTEEALKKVDMKLVTGAAHHDWMNYLGSMLSALSTIQSSADLEKQREAFSKLSDELYKTIKAYGLSGKTAYYEFCPMAFNNQGGYWLSQNEAIRNPYFGDKMLTCGSVKETLQY